MAQYFDNDFEWEEAASARRERCEGNEAPPLEPKETVQELTSQERLAHSWEAFYEKHENKFFKARAYLKQAFPSLCALDSSTDEFLIGEIGCGTGSSVLPLVEGHSNLTASVFDLSSSAITALQEQVENRALSARVQAVVCDAVTEELPFDPESLDFCLMVFTLSAVNQSDHLAVVKKAWNALKPGACLLFRDYGLFDMVQARCETRVGERQYIKQDGIQCYFFAVEYLEDLMRNAGYHIVENKYCTVRNVNRKKKLNIDRVFVNATFRKPYST